MKKKFPILPVILGTIIVVLAAFLMSFGLAFLANAILGAKFSGGVTSISLLIPSATVFMIYFFLFEGILFTMQAKTFKRLIDEDKPKWEKSDRGDRRFKMITRSIYIVIIAICLAFPAIYMNCYTKIEDGNITEKIVFVENEYTLDDITAYRLGMNDTGLVFYVNMYSGEKFELLQSDSIYSDKFNEKFESQYEFVAYLTDVFDSNPKIIKGQVTNAQEITDTYSSIPEIWTHISKIIEKHS